MITALDGPKNPAAGEQKVSLRSVALPVEHGGWGLLLEPLVVGLALAPSRAAAGLAMAAVGAFLARHPLKLILADRKRGARYPRTAAAERMAAAYAAAGTAGAALALSSAPPEAWLPILLAAPLALSQLWYDARHQGRALAPELMGGVALSSTAGAILLAGGREMETAVAVWALMALRAVTSVVYVRARLRRARAQPAGVGTAIGLQAATLGAAVWLVAIGWASPLAAAAFGILLLRAAHGFSGPPATLRPRTLGFQELGYGVVTALLLIAGGLAGR